MAIQEAEASRHERGAEAEEEAGLHFGFVGYSMAGILALAAIWITVFSASPGILPQPNPVYDFIVVGSGAAGSVVAARLANGTDYRVLLLEAGEEEPWVSKLPLSTLMLQGSKYDWQYYTEPQEFSSYGMMGKKSYWPRGMMLGGSTQLNYNIFTLGWRQHYDRWSAEHGLLGWASGDLIKYVRELFCFPEQGRGAEHGRSEEVISSAGEWSEERECQSGTMPLSPLSSDMSQAFASAAQELQSFNKTSSIQVGQMVTVHQGQRWSTLTTFLRPVMQSRSLHVVIQANVKKILFEGDRAVGVEWHQWGSAKNVRRTYVKAEVVLAAGAVNSPALLLRSGVGRREELDELEIPTVMHSPGVGQNLLDQMNLPVYVHINASMSINPAKLVTFQNFWKYFTSGDGLFADTGLGGTLTEYSAATKYSKTETEANCAENLKAVVQSRVQDLNDEMVDGTRDENSTTAAPEEAVAEGRESGEPELDSEEDTSPIGLLMFNMGSVERESYARAANLMLEVFDRAYPDMQNSTKEGVFLLASCLQPRSRGHVRHTHQSLRQPAIQPNYLKHPSDVQCMKRAFRLLERFVKTRTMQRIGATVHYPRPLRCSPASRPEADHRDAALSPTSASELGSDQRREQQNSPPPTGLTDEEVECTVRTLAFTGYHPIGTLKMGPVDDEDAVVDLQMRLRGVKGVRVVDASVLPSHPAPAPAGVVALYAARGADLIKETWWPIQKVRDVEPCYEGVCGDDLYYPSSSDTKQLSLSLVVLFCLVSSFTCFSA